jgi:hypothetical protein
MVTWDDVIPLLEGIKTRFPRRTYPLAKGSERRAFQAIDKFLDALSGGNGQDLMRMYLTSAKSGSHAVAQRRALKKIPLTDDVLLQNISALLDSCNERFETGERSDPVTNAVRFNLLKLVEGVFPRDDLMEAGFKFSKATWTNVAEHNQDHGMSAYYQDGSIGHPELSAEMKSCISDFVMTDEWSRVIPQKNPNIEGRALTHDISEIYKAFCKNPDPRRKKISEDRFRKSLSGHKDSATPNRRAFVHRTDDCVKCSERKAAIRRMNALIASNPHQERREKMTTILDEIVKASEESGDPSLGRARGNDLQEFVASVALDTAATADQLYELMQKIVVIGYHVYQYKLTNDHITSQWDKTEALVFRIIADWKEDVLMGRSAEEDSTVIKNLEQTAVFGLAFSFLHPTWKEMVYGTTMCFSEVTEKTAAAGIGFVDFVIDKLCAEYPEAAEALKTATRIESTLDSGRHFHCGAFLAHALLQMPKKYLGTADVLHHLVQIFIGGHGKTGRVDGSFAFISASMKALIKSGLKLKTVPQLMNYCKRRKQLQYQGFGKKKRDLHPWFFFEFKPSDASYPKVLETFVQQGVHSSWAWSSTYKKPKPTASALASALSPFEIKKLGIANTKPGLTMQSIPAGDKLDSPAHYQVIAVANVDKRNSTPRTKWKRRNATVADAPPTNLNTLEANRKSILAIKNQIAVRRAVALKPCKGDVVPKWTRQQLEATLQDSHSSTGIRLTVKSLTEELNRHGFNYSGTIEQATNKLLTHIKQVDHSVATTVRSRSKPLLEYFL